MTPSPPSRKLGVTRAKLREEKAKRELEKNRQRWFSDPVAFAKEALGVTLWQAQIDIALSVRDHDKTAVRSGHKVGKSTLIACLALWWAYTRPHAFVILSSGNLTQVKLVLWREVTRLYRGAQIRLGGELHKDPGTGLEFDDGRRIVGVTSADAERFAGFSSAGQILFLLDEASGIDDEIIETALGSLAGGGHILLAGNPTRTTGHFARVHREKPDGWSLHHVSSLQSPNVVSNSAVLPGLATRAWADSMAADFGLTSAAYAVRVLGEFAAQQDDAVIPLELLERATSAWVEFSSDVGPLEVGVDPARFGDDETVIQGRKGKRVLPASTHRKLDNIEVAARVVEYVQRFRDAGHLVTIRVDTGGLGSGVFDHLLRAFDHDPLAHIESVNAAQSAQYPRYARARDQLWFSIRHFLERGGTLPPDQKRDAELLAARYEHNPKMQIVVSSKDDMRKRLHRSPDRADALALACFSEAPLSEGERVNQTSVYLPPNANRVHPVLGPRIRAYESRSRAYGGDDSLQRQRALGAPPGGWRRDK